MISLKLQLVMSVHIQKKTSANWKIEKHRLSFQVTTSIICYGMASMTGGSGDNRQVVMSWPCQIFR